jgi:hypothetical protein
VLSVVAGKTHGPSSTAIGDGLKTAFAGQEAEFIIEARDIIGNQRVVGDDAFHVAMEGPSTPQISVFDRDDGTYLVSYVVSETGDYVVRSFTDPTPTSQCTDCASITTTQSKKGFTQNSSLHNRHLFAL